MLLEILYKKIYTYHSLFHSLRFKRSTLCTPNIKIADRGPSFHPEKHISHVSTPSTPSTPAAATKGQYLAFIQRAHFADTRALVARAASGRGEGLEILSYGWVSMSGCVGRIAGRGLRCRRRLASGVRGRGEERWALERRRVRS